MHVAVPLAGLRASFDKLPEGNTGMSSDAFGELAGASWQYASPARRLMATQALGLIASHS